MKKSKKIFIIIVFSLLAILGITYTVLYCINPAETQNITWQVIDYICNKPLPVIGVTSLVLIFAIFKIIRFVLYTKTQKIESLITEIKELKDKQDEYAALSEKLKEELLAYSQKTNDELNHKIETQNENIAKICYLSPNKKLKKLGDNLYGKKTNSNTEKE